MSTRDDHESLVDSLNRLPLVNRLASSVLTCDPPRVFGVHGDWGSGKTSFLRQLHYRLDGLPGRKAWSADQTRIFGEIRKTRACGFPDQLTGENRALVVWFEAWRYQHEAAPVVALLHEIRGQLSLLVRATAWGAKMGEVTLRSALLQLEQVAKFAWLQSAAGITVANRGSGLGATVQEQGERWERENLAEKLPAEAIREQLQHALGQLLGNQADGPQRRVIVLIDDLDRCEPLATYRLLEGIKIYLNIPNCVFVLGMDQRIIEDAIAESVTGVKDKPDNARRRAGEYLEKLFQEVYHLPIVQEVPNRVLEWLPEDTSLVTKAKRDAIKQLLTDYPGCVPANPRKIKAFAAVLWRFLTEPDADSVAAAKFSRIEEHKETAAAYPYEALVVIMASLYHSHADVYRVVEAHLEEFYEQLWRWCARTEKITETDHACLSGLDRAFAVITPVEASSNTLAETRSLYSDYSRGNVLRIQRLIYHARPYTRAQIRSLLLQ